MNFENFIGKIYVSNTVMAMLSDFNINYEFYLSGKNIFIVVEKLDKILVRVFCLNRGCFYKSFVIYLQEHCEEL